MYSKIINPIKHGNISYNNKSSAARLGNYLNKEPSSKQEKGIFFNAQGDFDKKQVVESIDNNVKGLTQKDDKFHSLVIAPSAKELEHIGNDHLKLKAFTIACMEKYAANFNFNSGKKLSEKDLIWYATIHQNRAFKGTDLEVLNGKKKSGDLKEGLQTHIHVVVSARDIEQKITLNPNTSNRNRFRMTAWFDANQRQFNQQFDFKPDPKEISPPKDKTAYFILWTEKKLQQLEKMGINDKQISEIRDIAKAKNNSTDFRRNLVEIVKDVRAKSKNQSPKDTLILPEQIKSLNNTASFKSKPELELSPPTKSFLGEFKSFQHFFATIATEDFNQNQGKVPKKKRNRKKGLSPNNNNQDISI
ncbi:MULTISPECIES: DUF5712 family protein [Emticicia]|uniref:DUF5712 family protein n=1 Tax=Emticicia TaxID=312278 RepID=UPI0007D8B5A1|nr:MULTISPECIES: DUF5712 family protein [Emticicia]